MLHVLSPTWQAGYVCMYHYNCCLFPMQKLPLHIKWPNDIYTYYKGQLVKVGGKIIDPLVSQSGDITIANAGISIVHFGIYLIAGKFAEMKLAKWAKLFLLAN